MTWGIAAPEGVKASWSARAIFERRKVDLLHDRQDTQGISEADKKALIEWVNGVGLKKIRAMAKKLSPSGMDTIEYDADGARIVACPRASCGHLYIGAWLK